MDLTRGPFASPRILEENDRLLRENKKLKSDLEMASSALNVYDSVFGKPQPSQLNMGITKIEHDGLD